jgi:hypothetical protein
MTLLGKTVLLPGSARASRAGDGALAIAGSLRVETNPSRDRPRGVSAGAPKRTREARALPDL